MRNASRNAGAEPNVYAAAGVSPLAELLAAPEETVARHAAPLIRQGMSLGYPPPDSPSDRGQPARQWNVPNHPEAALIHWLAELFSRRDGGDSGFFCLAEQMESRAGKDYVAVVAAVLKTMSDKGAPDTLIPCRDLPVPPPPPAQLHYMNSLSPAPLVPDFLLQYKRRGSGEWRGLDLQKNTGPRMAAVKCLLPEARCATINWLSGLAAGQPAAEPPLSMEWNAWDIPPETVAALALRVLGKRGTQDGESFARLGRDMDARMRWLGMEALQQFNAEAEQRNPVLLTGQVLDLMPRDDLRSWLDKRTKARRPAPGCGPRGRRAAGSAAPAAKRPGGRSVHNAHCPVVAVQSRSAGCNRDTCFFAMTTLFNCSIKQFYAMAADSNRDAGSFALFRHAAAPAPARGTGLTALKKFYLKINQQEAQRDEVAFAPPQRSAGGWLVSGES